MRYPLPANESSRLKALADLGIIGSGREHPFDSLVTLTTKIFDVPAALISLLDDHQQWFKAYHGLSICSTEREMAFCNYPVASGELLVVEDATRDPRFSQNRLVTGDPHIRFYAGVPLSIDPGVHLGALGIVDFTSRVLTADEAGQLHEIAELATALLRQFRDGRTLRRLNEQVVEQTTQLTRQKVLFDRASALTKLGAWDWNLSDDTLQWTDGMYDIHDLPRGSPIVIDQIHAFYPEANRAELGRLTEKSMREKSGYVFEGPMVTFAGRQRWIRLTAEVECENGEVVRRYGVKQDITEQKAVWDKMLFLSSCDPLTGLSNRTAFHARLSDLFARPKPRPVSTLLLIDVDGFKGINDTFGHPVGDDCLKQIAERLRKLCPSGGLVARLGGDEFGMLIEEPDEKVQIDWAKRVLSLFRRPMTWDGQSAQLTASIGVAFSTSANTASDLFKDADLALYSAKAAGRNTVHHFQPQMKEKANERFELIQRIGAALDLNQLRLFYQPKVDLRRGEALAGFEALLRWQHPNGDIVPAGAFADALLDPVLSNRIGKWVVKEALRQARTWKDAGLDFRHIAINLSSGQFREPGLSLRLIDQIADHGLRPEMIEVEVTESVFLDGEAGEVRETLLALRSAGIRIALDDFGTGYASLSHLRSFPIDIIKVDRSFVQHFLTAPRDHAIVESILFLARHLELDVVAEGIEDSEQRAFLSALGCRYGQGHLFSQALPAAQAATWCEQRGHEMGERKSSMFGRAP